MNRPSLIVMFAIAVIAVCALTSCASNQPGPIANVPTPSVERNNNAGQTSKSGRKYSRGIAGEGAEGARGASFITLNSSDGMEFTKWSTNYETPERASAELQRKLGKALEIVSREPTLDANGREIGQKVVARFAPSNRDAGPASLLWTEGSELFQVDSSSTENILEYRKDFNR